MKNSFVGALSVAISFLVTAISTEMALAQDTSMSGQGRLGEAKMPAKGTPTNVAAVSPPNLLVSKTAQVSGQDVCGVIRITNIGWSPANVVGIADSLEVHFPNNVPPPGLTAGSTPNWFKVADVPIALPAPVAPLATTTINYCFSLCQARDYPGANSMRNSVRVSVANPPGSPRTFPALSNSFTPPFPDCRACCLPDGSCTDTVPARCSSAGGLAKGPNTDCATSPCRQACCHADLTCSDDPKSSCQGDAQGLGTECASTDCCLPPSSDIHAPHCTGDGDCCAGTCFDFVGSQRCCVDNGDSGCVADADCCFSEYGATCNGGTCCFPPTVESITGNCRGDADCCAGTCFDFVGVQKCCFESGSTGCAADSECCFFQGGAICNVGTCCIPPTVEPITGNCRGDADCCAGTCFDFVGVQKCCFESGSTGCAADSECCFFQGGAICNAGTCCIPPTVEPVTGNCRGDADCCAGTCFDFVGVQKCCFELGATGCTADSECCFFQAGATCNGGTCCLPPSRDPFAGHCTDNADCCGSSVCGSDNFCCLPNFSSGCSSDSQCCSGLVCNGGLCEGVNAP